MKRIRKAVFPVAGLGTRFLPATKSVPKEMLTVVDKPVIQHVVEEAKEAEEAAEQAAEGAEPQAADAEEEWAIPVKGKKGKKNAMATPDPLSRQTPEAPDGFTTGGGKKKKGGKRDNAAPAAAGKFQLDVGTIENLGRINVDPPMQQSDVPAAAEKLKEKLAFWKENQESKTKEVRSLEIPN